MDTNNQDYVLRIANATPVELVVLHFELILLGVDNALHTIGEDVYYKHIENAKLFLRELIFALNLDVEMAGTLLSLYRHSNELLIEAGIVRDEGKCQENLRHVRDILTPLQEAWVEIAATETQTPRNTTLYAGLTYNKAGQMEELWLDEDKGIDI